MTFPLYPSYLEARCTQSCEEEGHDDEVARGRADGHAQLEEQLLEGVIHDLDGEAARHLAVPLVGAGSVTVTTGFRMAWTSGPAGTLTSCTARHCTARHCTARQCTARHCSEKECRTRECSVLAGTPPSRQ